MAEWNGQVDHVHLVRVRHFVPRPRMTTEQLRGENVHDIRWWSTDEIRPAGASFAPGRGPGPVYEETCRSYPESTSVSRAGRR